MWVWPPRSRIPSTVRLHRSLPGGCDPERGWAVSELELTGGGAHVGDSGGLTVQTQVTAHSWHRNKNPAGMLEIVLLVVCLIKFHWLVMSSIYLYSPVSQITSLPQEGLQSVEHTAPSILRRLIQIRKSSRLSSANTTHTEMKIFKLRWGIFTFHLFFKKNLFIKAFFKWVKTSVTPIN